MMTPDERQARAMRHLGVIAERAGLVAELWRDVSAAEVRAGVAPTELELGRQGPEAIADAVRGWALLTRALDELADAYTAAQVDTLARSELRAWAAPEDRPG